MRTAAPPSALCLERYLEGLDGVPIPTPEQRAGFAEFVSEAHSWYKHLPRFTPGEPFTLFLDRHAGCDLERSADGSAEMVPRIRQRSFHYSAIATADYRNRYGHLAYATRHRLFDEGAQLYGLPAEIRSAGGITLTACIHPCSARYSHWDLRIEGQTIGWPEESGGQQALEKIFERCRWMRRAAPEPGALSRYPKSQARSRRFSMPARSAQ